MNETMNLLFFFKFPNNKLQPMRGHRKTLVSMVFFSKNMQKEFAFLAKATSFCGGPLIKTFVAKVLPLGGSPCYKGLEVVWSLSQGLGAQGSPYYKGLELLWSFSQGLAAQGHPSCKGSVLLPLLQGLAHPSIINRWSTASGKLSKGLPLVYHQCFSW